MFHGNHKVRAEWLLKVQSKTPGRKTRVTRNNRKKNPCHQERQLRTGQLRILREYCSTIFEGNLFYSKKTDRQIGFPRTKQSTETKRDRTQPRWLPTGTGSAPEHSTISASNIKKKKCSA